MSVAVEDAAELVNRCPRRTSKIDIRHQHVVGRRVVADGAQLLGRADLDVAVVVFVESLPLRYAHRIGQNRRFFVLPAGKDIPFLRRARPVVSRNVARKDIVLLVKYRSVLVPPANRAVVAAVLAVAEPHQVFQALVRLAVNGNGYRPADVHRIKTISAGVVAAHQRKPVPTLGRLPTAGGQNVVCRILENPRAVDYERHVVVVALFELPIPDLVPPHEEPAVEPHLRSPRHHTLGILAVGVILVKDFYGIRLAGRRVVLDRIVPAEQLAAVGHGAPRYSGYGGCAVLELRRIDGVAGYLNDLRRPTGERIPPVLVRRLLRNASVVGRHRTRIDVRIRLQQRSVPVLPKDDARRDSRAKYRQIVENLFAGGRYVVNLERQGRERPVELERPVPEFSVWRLRIAPGLGERKAVHNRSIHANPPLRPPIAIDLHLVKLDALHVCRRTEIDSKRRHVVVECA